MVVLDEADTMFDAGFGSEVRALLRPLRSKAQPAACVLVAATLSKASRPLPAHALLAMPQSADRLGVDALPLSLRAPPAMCLVFSRLMKCATGHCPASRAGRHMLRAAGGSSLR